MKTIHYPLLYFQLGDDAVLGLLVGTEYKMVGKDLKMVKSSLTDHLQKVYKKHREYSYAPMLHPKLKMIEIKVRPRYRDEGVSFASSTMVKLSVPVVHGEADSGDNMHLCYLPLLNDHFSFYDARQFRSLVNYFATDHYNKLSPEEIYRHIQYPEPKLDSISLRIKEEFHSDWNGFQFEMKFEKLNRLAEKYPYSKAVRKSQSQFPEVAWELEDEVKECIRLIYSQRANVLVVGKNGVGKSAVLKQAIKRVSSQAKKEKAEINFWRIMAQRITATAQYLGDWQKSVEDLVRELSDANGVLWVENVIQLLKEGGGGPEDSVAAFLTSFLQNDGVQIIGEVTEKELESMRRFLPGFVECFQLLKIEELTENQVRSVMNQFADFSNKNLKVKIPQEAIQLSYRLLLRYYPYESFPGKAVRFFQQCVNNAKLDETFEVTPKDVIQNFTRQTGLPELFLRDDLLLKKGDLKKYFTSKIIGQPDAIDSLVNVVTIFKAGLNDHKKPINTLLFAGSTGVGKTACAKALANYFFGEGQATDPLVRIDMSEFQHPSQITQLIGSGQEIGKLVQEIRERPFAVLLLDEVEKAHRSIFDALLTVLDEGILVDAYGRVTNFRNTIVIMTTNLGSANRNSISFTDTTSNKNKYLSAISSFFRPEFVNRIDNVVIFNALKKNDIKKIILIELEEVRKREGFIKRNLELKFTQRVIDFLSEVGFDEQYGARPLQRAIEQQMINPISNWLLENPKTKDCTLKIDYDRALKIL